MGICKLYKWEMGKWEMGKWERYLYVDKCLSYIGKK